MASPIPFASQRGADPSPALRQTLASDIANAPVGLAASSLGAEHMVSTGRAAPAERGWWGSPRHESTASEFTC